MKKLIPLLLALALLLPLGGCGQKSAYEKAVKMLSNYKPEDVVAAFEKAGDYQDAPMIADMYQKYIDRNYKAANDAFFVYQRAGYTAVSLNDWIYDILYNVYYNTDKETFTFIRDAYRPALTAYLGDGFCFEIHSSPLQTKPSMVNFTRNTVLGGTFDELLAQCGTAPNGKTIVCAKNELTGVTTKLGTGVLSMGLTAMLPEEAIPASLDEVEYIILITEKESTAGTYTDGTRALVITDTVSVLSCPGAEVQYNIGFVTGGDPPGHSVQTGRDTYGNAPDWSEVAALLDNAVKAIYEQ